MLAAARRLALLVLGCSILTAGFSALFGELLGASLDRAVSLGFYGLGCFLMVSGFFVGNRGPARVKSEASGWSMLTASSRPFNVAPCSTTRAARSTTTS